MKLNTDVKLHILSPLEKLYHNDEIPKEYISKLFDNSTEEFKKLDE